MDKRFLIFLALAAVIVFVTPRFFPTPPARKTPQRDSSARASTARGAESRSAGTTAAAPPRASVVPVPVSGVPTDTGVAPRADTITVSTPRAAYRLSTLGARFLNAELHDYRALDSAGGNVVLAHAGTPLLALAFIGSSGDTIALDRFPFSVDSGGLRDAQRPSVTLTGNPGGYHVAVTYTFSPDSYVVRVRGTVTAPGDSGARTLLIRLPDGLRSSEADSLDDQRQLAYVVRTMSEDENSESFGKLSAGTAKVEMGPLSWAASKNKFFVVALLADTTAPFGGALLQGLPSTSKVSNHAMATVVQSLGSGGGFSFTVYAGPQEWKHLLAVGRSLQNVNPYGGWLRGIVQPFATIVMRLLLWMHDTLRLSYGWVVVIFGVAIRGLTWPLNQRAMRSQLQMQRLQPEIQAIQKKYKNAPEKLNTEMMRFYRENNMSPFAALGGCLPMLIPMPILYALYFVFESTIEFRGVSFLWLHDISQRDPYYILPIAMGVSMFFVSWIGLRASPPNPQAKMMSYTMPLLFVFLFKNWSAGLNLYYAVQNIASLPQQWLIARERAKAAPPQVVGGKPS